VFNHYVKATAFPGLGTLGTLGTPVMTHARIEHIGKHVGEMVAIKGWLHNRRSSGKIHFLVVRDGTGFLQVVMGKNDVPEETFKAADHLTQESAIIVTGTVREDKRAKGGYELTANGLEVVSPAGEYPITPKEHGVDFLLDRRHLWIRTERQVAILRVRHEIIDAVRDFFNSNGFILADTPIFTPAACEGTTTLFPVQYFEDETAYLTQSGQLYNEANAMALGKVYAFGPTFRAEKSKTRRHLTEFWMVEPEMAYADLNDVIALAEGLLTSVVARVLDKRRNELKVLERDTSKLERVTAPFPRLHYDDAAKILLEKGLPFQVGGDLGGTDETVLSEQFDRPVCVTHYPAAVKAFYMKPDPAQPDRALCVDVLAPEGYGEIIGGGQRLDDYDLLLQRIKEHNLPVEAFEWYLDLRRYGSVPHSGFGMGIERCVAWICGLEHVRETVPYPRMLYRLYP
jgi:asparaginyl-tRNA synthetase